MSKRKKSEETISFRNEKLSGILKTGKITDEEKDVIKSYYAKYYVPVGNDTIKNVKDIQIIKNKNFNTNCFTFIFDDKTEAIISKKFLTGEKKYDGYYKNNSMRNAIKPQIEEFGNKYKKPNDGNEYEVGHYPDFCEIQKEFLDQHNNGEDPKHENDYQLKNNILPAKLLIPWQEFHNSKATLKWTLKEENRLHQKSWEKKRPDEPSVQ